MKYKAIHTEKGKILVDEAAEIKEGETGYNSHDERFDVCTVLNKESIQEHWDKIIATINFSIDKDVPMIVVKDEVEKLAEHSSEVQEGTYTTPHKTTYKHGFIDGYKAAQQKGVYSEEDLRKDLFGFQNFTEEYDETYSFETLVNEYIQSLKQESIELEMEIDTTKIDNCNMFANEIGCTLSKCKCENEFIPKLKTARVDGGQLMAYVKNK